jgi:hypothetical protein
VIKQALDTRVYGLVLPHPKNRGPDQCVPVIRSAITVRDARWIASPN